MRPRSLLLIGPIALLGWASAGGIGCAPGMDMAPLPDTGSEPDGNEAMVENPTASNPVEADPFDPAGVWQLESGAIFTDVIGRDRFDLQFLVLEAGGTGRAFLKHRSTDVLNCLDGLHARVGNQTLLLDVPGLTGCSFCSDHGTFTVLIDRPDADTLVLMSAIGQTARFVRRAAVPGELQCRSLRIEQTFTPEGLQPSDRGGLVFDGMALWFLERDEKSVRAIDPATGALGQEIEFASIREVHAIQAGDFWIRLGSESAHRRTQADVEVDTVDTRTDLNEPISIHAIAYAENTSLLWLHGRNRGENIRKFLKVNSDAEPDMLLDKVEFDIRLIAMTWDGTHLWAIADGEAPTIIQIDADTLRPLAHYRSPDPTVRWHGIAAVDSSLFLIGFNASREGLLMKVSHNPPGPEIP